MPEVHYLGQKKSVDSDPGSLSKCKVTIVSRIGENQLVLVLLVYGIEYL